MLQNDNHIFLGLQLDTSVSKQSSEYLIDAHNIRITSRGDETLLSITNERGPKELSLVNTVGNPTSISGTILGHYVLNNYLVLFTHASDTDHIYRINMEGTPTVVNLFTGNLNFNNSHPIEAIGDYENESIQKIYWTDGYNQPRVINIMDTSYNWGGAFDFVPELQLNENIEITKITSAGGIFPPGVIQYAFSYYNKHGQETNIFHTTPLYYTSYFDRGGSPEDTMSNAFEIKVFGVDSHFQYLRIYSIMRTSINGTPICKRILDIDLDSSIDGMVHFIDNGTSGDTVDPTSLLYIGGEEITAKTLCDKDGTLFLGNLKIQRPSVYSIPNIVTNIRLSNSNLSSGVKSVTLTPVSRSAGYSYDNGLSTQAAGFKNREYYRVGLQAQYKNGKWSDPLYIADYQVEVANGPSCTIESYPVATATLNKVVINYTLSTERCNELIAAGYKKVRPVVVFPLLLDRTILYQGVINPTLYTSGHRNNNDLHAQSSWFFRPLLHGVTNLSTYASSYHYSLTSASPYSLGNQTLPYTDTALNFNPSTIRATEIQGNYDADDKFTVDWDRVTLHSPDVEFDDAVQTMDLSLIKCRYVGKAVINGVSSDINIQTSTPTISNSGSGFTHKAFVNSYSKGIISGLYYEDFVVDDNRGKYEAFTTEKNPVRWMVYAWLKGGSLNNDVNRPADAGVRTAELKKKVISNLRYSTTKWDTVNKSETLISALEYVPQVFNSDQVSIVKLSGEIYLGNIDTLLTPNKAEGLYFAFHTNPGVDPNLTLTSYTPFESEQMWKTWSESSETASNQGLYKAYNNSGTWNWVKKVSVIADDNVSLAVQKDAVRMKYKSTPHVVMKISLLGDKTNATDDCVLPIVELYRDYNIDTMFGGQSADALKSNEWLPAGQAKHLVLGTSCNLVYEYGDTWYSRYDCLKTYPFTPEDVNQIVEIGSFMLETRVNIDGRYDRNRGQVNNLNVSPTNFNLINPVYSLKDNFFTYRILDDDFYNINRFPNQITWSKTKAPSADVDLWASITMASTLNLDGSKGEIRALKTWNSQIYCFLDVSISNILYNSRVQVQASDGVPIEISNSNKVEGTRYVTETIGCINKYAITASAAGLYFIDATSGHLQVISGSGLLDLSFLKNMVTWFNKLNKSQWTPNLYTSRLFYDGGNKDLYIITGTEALCFNELLGLFVSFMSYDNIPVMFTCKDKFYCIKSNYLNEMFAGEYNYFFDRYLGYDITFVSNGLSKNANLTTADKTFTNIDFRADKWSDDLDSILSFETPFDYVRVWNEYQDTGEVILHHIKDKPSILKKKFRVWRITIPRNAVNRRDRIRNTWSKITLGSAPRYNDGNNSAIQFHDVNVIFMV